MVVTYFPASRQSRNKVYQGLTFFIKEYWPEAGVFSCLDRHGQKGHVRRTVLETGARPARVEASPGEGHPFGFSRSEPNTYGVKGEMQAGQWTLMLLVVGL